MKIQNLLKSMAPSRSANPPARKSDSLDSSDEQSLLDGAGDHVAISHAAVNEMRETSNAKAELRTLISFTPLSDERAALVRDRIDDRFYQHPTIVRKVAHAIVGVLEADLP